MYNIFIAQLKKSKNTKTAVSVLIIIIAIAMIWHSLIGLSYTKQNELKVHILVLQTADCRVHNY